MEVRELIKEKVLVEIVAERDGMILNQHQQLESLQKEIEAMKAKIETLQDVQDEGKKEGWNESL